MDVKCKCKDLRAFDRSSIIVAVDRPERLQEHSSCGALLVCSICRRKDQRRFPKGRGEQRQWTLGTTYLRKTWHHHGKKASFNRQCSALRNILMGNLASCCRTTARQLSNPWEHHLSLMRTLKDLLLTSCCQRRGLYCQSKNDTIISGQHSKLCPWISYWAANA